MISIGIQIPLKDNKFNVVDFFLNENAGITMQGN